MRHAPDDLPILARARPLALHAPPRPGDEVTILLALHNGARFITDQLDSLAAQTHGAWRLVVSDDGSTDDGPLQVLRWAVRHPGHDVRLIPGPCRGFAANFLRLLSAVGPDARLVAFADQDDVWLPGKLSRAVDRLAMVEERTPALYCSQTWICDARLGRPLRSRLWERPPSFRNALVQNIAAGNTIVLNHAAQRLLRAAARRVQDVAAHDWWAYQVVSGAGGVILPDEVPSLLYRQHGANVIGANRGLRAMLRRGRIVLTGTYRDWNAMNIAALHRATPYLTPESRALLAEFAQARGAAGPRCATRLGRAGLRRQTWIGTAALWAAASVGLV